MGFLSMLDACIEDAFLLKLRVHLESRLLQIESVIRESEKPISIGYKIHCYEKHSVDSECFWIFKIRGGLVKIHGGSLWGTSEKFAGHLWGTSRNTGYRHDVCVLLFCWDYFYSN